MEAALAAIAKAAGWTVIACNVSVASPQPKAFRVDCGQLEGATTLRDQRNQVYIGALQSLLGEDRAVFLITNWGALPDRVTWIRARDRIMCGDAGALLDALADSRAR